MPRPALLALLIILPLTMGLRPTNQGETKIDTDRLSAEAASSLTAADWSVRTLGHPLIGPLIEGTRHDCHILVHFMPPEGASDSKFQRIAQPVGPVTYRYRGQSSDAFPRLGPMLHRHAQRYASGFGLTVAIAPVIAIARSPSCGAQLPDLSGLRQHLQPAA